MKKRGRRDEPGAPASYRKVIRGRNTPRPPGKVASSPIGAKPKSARITDPAPDPRLDPRWAEPGTVRASWDTPSHRREKTLGTRDVGAESLNERGKKSGLATVISVRLAPKLIDALDTIVADAVGSYPPVTRTTLIQLAIEAMLADAARERKRGAA